MENAIDDGLRGVRRLEVVETGRRRRWTDEAKIGLVGEILEPGASVSSVARRHGIAPTQIYEWRRKFCLQAARPAAGAFAAVVVTPDGPAEMVSGGRMEIVCSGGRRIIVDRDVDVAALRRVVAGLEP
jgi:transposase